MTVCALYAYSYTGIFDGSTLRLDNLHIIVLSLFLAVFLMKLAENLKVEKIKKELSK